MDLETDETTVEVLRASVLAFQLPRDSRVKKAIAPELSYGVETQLLRAIEHNQRLWHWANTKEAKHKETAPSPLSLPGEDEAHEKAVERAESQARRTADRLGIKL